MPEPRQEYEELVRKLGPNPRVLGGMPLAPTSGIGVLMDVLAGLPEDWKNRSGANWAIIPTRRNKQQFNELVRDLYRSAQGANLPDAVRFAMSFWQARHPYTVERVVQPGLATLNDPNQSVLPGNPVAYGHFQPEVPELIPVTPRDPGKGEQSGMGTPGWIRRMVGSAAIDPEPFGPTRPVGVEHVIDVLGHESTHGIQHARYPRRVRQGEEYMAELKAGFDAGKIDAKTLERLYKKHPMEKDARWGGTRALQEFWDWADLNQAAPLTAEAREARRKKIERIRAARRRK